MKQVRRAPWAGMKAADASGRVGCASAPASGGQPTRETVESEAFRGLLQTGADLLRRDDPRGAAVSLAAAIQLRPDSPEAITNLGVAWLRLGDPHRATVCYRKAIALQASFAPAHSNLGQALAVLGHTGQAIQSLETALGFDPSLLDAWVNLGAALKDNGQLNVAAEVCRHALRLAPGDADGLLNLGNALKEQGLLGEAAGCYRRAANASAPGDARGLNNLGEALRDQGEIAAAAQAYEQALAASPSDAVAYSNLLYLHAFTRDISPAAELELARGWERAVLPAAERQGARAAASPSSGVFGASPRNGRRLRVGILSAELGSHAVAEFLEPFLEDLDKSRFHLTLFPSAARHGERAVRLQSLADAFLPVTGLSATAAVERIRAQQIDVLIDTSGHTAGNRLDIFARRAAPVQATYIGYWSTTGLTEMDYFIADPDPPAAIEAHFSERLWRLSRLGVCYRGDPLLAIDWQPDPEGTLWLGSFNKFAKIRDQTIALWAGALHALPAAQLLLEDRGAYEDESHSRLRAGFASHGIAGDRVQFIPFAPGHERHMLLYNRLDIALDTVPFNGGTTTFDALWMGVPVVTVEGETEGARISGAALQALGHPEWIAAGPEAFGARVRELAEALPCDASGRQARRRALRAQMASGPLCDAAGLTRSLESALEGMHENWLRLAAERPLRTE